MKRAFLVLLALLVQANLAAAQDPDFLYFCPATGSAQTESAKQLNRLKNRRDLPATADFDYTLTLERLTRPGNDRSRWFNGQAVEVLAYVVAVRDAAPDSSTCHRAWRELTSSQLELAVSADPRATRPTRRMFAAVTPRMREELRAHGLDWSTESLRRQFEGRFVIVQGWLVFDLEDAAVAKNTRRGAARVERATAWEIHPVTSLELLPPAVGGWVDSAAPAELGLEIQPFSFTAR